MSETFNLSASTHKTLDQLYKDKVIDSKELFVELGIAVGLAVRKKGDVKSPRPFHTLSELDKGHVFSVIASTRNLDITTEEEVTRELERYAEAGLAEMMDKDISDGKLNYYKVLKKYSER
jgi:hypothetical protein